jgi:hypothetical protein
MVLHPNAWVTLTGKHSTWSLVTLVTMSTMVSATREMKMTISPTGLQETALAENADQTRSQILLLTITTTEPMMISV